MPDNISPPGLMLRMLEGRAAAEAARLMLQMPILRLSATRGQGEPVLVLPGFMSNDTSTVILRGYLQDIGYNVRGWRLGVNRHRMLDFVPKIIDIVERMVVAHEQKVRLVGWSRGGIISREVARDRPDLIDRVITIGTPVKGGTNVSSIGRWVRYETGLTPEQVSNLLRERQHTPITVPIRAIYSKLDGVVAWRACIDESNPDVEHFEVGASHTGMGANVEVFKLLPELLR